MEDPPLHRAAALVRETLSILDAAEVGGLAAPHLSLGLDLLEREILKAAMSVPPPASGGASPDFPA